MSAEMKNCHRVSAQAVESRDVLLDLLPVRRVPDVVGDVADAVETDEEMNPFELLPERNQFFGKNCAVGVVAKPDVASVTRFAACLDERELLFNQERFATGENDFFHMRQKRLQVRPKLLVAIPLEAISLDRRGEMPCFRFTLLRDLTLALCHLHPAARFLRPAHKPLHIARVSEPQIDILERGIESPVRRCVVDQLSYPSLAALLLPAFRFCAPE